MEERIQRFEAAVWEQAPLRASFANQVKRDRRDTSGLVPFMCDDPANEKYRLPLPHWFRYQMLELFRLNCEDGHIQEVGKVLDAIFRDEMTKGGARLGSFYVNRDYFVELLEELKRSKKEVSEVRTEYDDRINKQIEELITDERRRLILQIMIDHVEDRVADSALPTDDDLERIERCRSRNDRRLTRHLQDLEIMRRLRNNV